MTTRWAVEVDGLGMFAIAEQGTERNRIVSKPMSLEKCEREIIKLRESEQASTLERKREHGRRLAAARWDR